MQMCRRVAATVPVGRPTAARLGASIPEHYHGLVPEDEDDLPPLVLAVAGQGLSVVRGMLEVSSRAARAGEGQDLVRSGFRANRKASPFARCQISSMQSHEARWRLEMSLTNAQVAHCSCRGRAGPPQCKLRRSSASCFVHLLLIGREASQAKQKPLFSQHRNHCQR